MIDWEAVSAVGQCVGALATLGAVLVALRQSQPRVVVRAEVCDIWGEDYASGAVRRIAENRLMVTAVNVGLVPVRIVSMGLRGPRGYRSSVIHPEPDALPKTIMPGESARVWADYRKLQEKGWTRIDVAWAADSSGKIYYVSVSLRARLERWLWWKLGRLDKRMQIQQGRKASTSRSTPGGDACGRERWGDRDENGV